MRPPRLKLALCLLLVGLLLLYFTLDEYRITDDWGYKMWMPLRLSTDNNDSVRSNFSTSGPLASTKHQKEPTRIPEILESTETSTRGDGLASILQRLNLSNAEIADAMSDYAVTIDEEALTHLGNLDAMNLSNWKKKYGCRTVQLCLVLALLNTTSASSSSTPFDYQDQELETCPVVPPNLVGPIQVWMDTPSIEKLEQLYPDLAPGGHGQPKECKARHRVAIIIPYRDRESHLKKLLHNLHSLLAKQQLDYVIFVVEQVANQTFNRGKLMNVGFREASKLYDWQCFIFHDVDLLPEDDRNLYSCPEQPRHMSVAIDKFGYKLPYWSIFGGISAMTREQYEKLNGFSNDYWGWGGEDDDVSKRVSLSGFSISRYPTEISRYKMIKHSHDSSNPVNKCRFKLLKRTNTRWKADGLSNLDYRVVDIQFNHLYTNIKVDLLEESSRKKLTAQRIGKEC